MELWHFTLHLILSFMYGGHISALEFSDDDTNAMMNASKSVLSRRTMTGKNSKAGSKVPKSQNTPKSPKKSKKVSQPSEEPSEEPSFVQSSEPSFNPSFLPSMSVVPSNSPSSMPSSVPSFSPSESSAPTSCMKPSQQYDYILVGDSNVFAGGGVYGGADCMTTSTSFFNPENQKLLLDISNHETAPCLQMGSKILVDTQYTAPGPLTPLKVAYANGLKTTLESMIGTGMVDINSSVFTEDSLDISVHKTLILYGPTLPSSIVPILGDFMKFGGRVIFIGELSGNEGINAALETLGGISKVGSFDSSLSSFAGQNGGKWLVPDENICVIQGTNIISAPAATIIATYNDTPNHSPLIVADNIDRMS